MDPGTAVTTFNLTVAIPTPTLNLALWAAIMAVLVLAYLAATLADLGRTRELSRGRARDAGRRLAVVRVAVRGRSR